MRLQQFLARAGVASRRKAEELIRSGQVRLNGHVAELGQSVSPQDQVTVGGKPIQLPQRRMVIALHKPAGYTTTRYDPHAEKTVFELLPDIAALHPVGRLDRDSEGLLLLSTDGNLTLKLTHPRYGVRKVYRVWCKGGTLPLEVCQRLEEGLEMEEGLAKALEAQPAEGGARLVLEEGKKREVRRMLQMVGYPVLRLLRTQISFLRLGDLEPGKWRYLKDSEIKRLETPARPARNRNDKPRNLPPSQARVRASRQNQSRRQSQDGVEDKEKPQRRKASLQQPSQTPPSQPRQPNNDRWQQGGERPRGPRKPGRSANPLGQPERGPKPSASQHEHPSKPPREDRASFVKPGKALPDSSFKRVSKPQAPKDPSYKRPAKRDSSPVPDAGYKRPAKRDSSPVPDAGYKRPAKRDSSPAPDAGYKRPAKRDSSPVPDAGYKRTPKPKPEREDGPSFKRSTKPEPSAPKDPSFKGSGKPKPQAPKGQGFKRPQQPAKSPRKGKAGKIER